MVEHTASLPDRFSIAHPLAVEREAFWSRLVSWAGKSGLAILDQGLISGSNFLISILLARWLMPDQYGAYALAFSFFVLFSLLYQALLLEPMAVFGGSAYQKSLRGYLASLLRLHLGITLVVMVGLGVAAVVLRHSAPAAGLSGAFAGVTLAAPCILLFWLARRTFYLELSPSRAATGSLLYCALVLSGLFLAYRQGLASPFVAFLLMALAALATGSILLARIQSSLPPGGTALRVREVWKKHWTYGRWALAGCVASWIPAYIYYPLLGTFSGMAHTGELRALLNFALPMEQTQTALSMLFLPYAARVYSMHGRNCVAKLTTRLTLLTVGGAIAYWAFIVSFRGPVFRLLYSGKYMDVAHLLPIVAVGSIFWSAVYGPAVVLRAMESPKSIFIAYFAATVVSLAVGIPATHAFGLAGGIWGINLSDIASFFMVLFLLRRKVTTVS